MSRYAMACWSSLSSGTRPGDKSMQAPNGTAFNSKSSAVTWLGASGSPSIANSSFMPGGTRLHLLLLLLLLLPSLLLLLLPSPLLLLLPSLLPLLLLLLLPLLLLACCSCCCL